MARTPSTRTKNTAATKKTASKKAPRTRKQQTPPRLSLVKPPRPRLDHRPTDWMTDLQGYATLAARLAGITTPHIQAWQDHRDGTTTRPLEDGSHLHYTAATRTLRWHTPCPMGAIHEYVLRTPADTDVAQADANTCQRPHWTPPPTNTGHHLTARLQTASRAAADTQPMSIREIAAGITAHADHDQPKGHPEP